MSKNGFSLSLATRLILVILAASLAACGGGSSGGSSVTIDPVTTEPPAEEETPVEDDDSGPAPEPENIAPTISGSPGSSSIGEEEAFSFTPTAVDENGDSLSFSVENLPTWATFDPATGAITGTPSLTDAGDYPDIVIAVSDGEDSTALPAFDISVFDVTVLQLSGVITDNPVSNANVSVEVGDEIFFTQADIDGNYSIEVRVATDLFSASLVTVTGQGVDSQSGVELISQVGSLASLVELAGSDNTVTSADQPRLIASHLSTAKYLLASDYNGGQVPNNEPDLFAAEAATQSEELLELAALIKLVVDEGLIAIDDSNSSLEIFSSLEEGGSNRVAIADLLLTTGITDENGDFTDGVQASVDAAIASILADTNLTTGFENADLSGILLSYQPLLPGDIPTSVSTYVFEENGSGTRYPTIFSQNFTPVSDGEGFEIPSNQFSWSLTSDGTLVLNVDEPATVTNSASLEELEALGFGEDVLNFIEQNVLTNFITVNSVITQRVMQSVSRDQTRWSVFVTESGYYEIDDVLISAGWVDELPRPVAREVQNQVLQKTDPTPEQIAKLPDAGDQAALRIIMTPEDDRVSEELIGFGIDLFTLQADGTTTPGLINGRAFNWFKDDSGNLILQNSDAKYTYTPLQSNGLQQLALITVERQDSPVQYTTGKIALKGAGSEEFINALPSLVLPEYWQAGINNTRSSAYRDNGMLRPEFIFGYSLRSGGTNTRVFGPIEYPRCLDDEDIFSPCFFVENPDWTWAAQDSRIQLERTSDFATQRFRRWEVLSYDSVTRSALVVEWSLIKFIGADQWTWFFFPRINWLSPGDLSDYPQEYQQAIDRGSLEF